MTTSPTWRAPGRGLTDVAIDALGGTGYLRTNEVAHFPSYLTRARVNLGGRRARPQLIVVGGSINDAVYSEARVKRAAAALYGYLRRAVPSARVIVVPFASTYPVPGAEAAANQGILAAARAAPNVVGVLDLPARVTSLAGAAGVERRSGALDSEAVKYHPSEAGHRLYGRIIGTFLADCVDETQSAAERPGGSATRRVDQPSGCHRSPWSGRERSGAYSRRWRPDQRYRLATIPWTRPEVLMLAQGGSESSRTVPGQISRRAPGPITLLRMAGTARSRA